MFVHIGLLYFAEEVKLFISIVLVFSMFLKKVSKNFIKDKNIKSIIFRVQANNSIMCGYICIRFIDFMLAGKKMTDFTSLFSPNDFEKKDSIISSYLKDE